MKPKSETKLLLIMGIFVLLGAGALFGLNALGGGSHSPTPEATPTPQQWTAEKFDTLIKNAREVHGDPNAPVTMIEFADFQCPSCRRAYNNVLAKLGPKAPVRLAFYHYPLKMHEMAMPAAIATEAAAKQKRFWPMYDALFTNEKAELSESYILDCAKQAGLDMAQFERDRKDPALQSAVQGDIATGDKNGVAMTPTFIIRDTSGTITQVAGANDFARQVLAMTALKPFTRGIETPPPPTPTPAAP